MAFFLTTMLRSMSLFSIGMLLQFRMRDVGASLFMIGFLSTVRGGISTLFPPFWGYMSDRLMNRKV
ncbi:MAG TPA: MFS transporter, partial [Thermotoga sp.]|nr:MFS transporter [Thermotoga sp.]